MSCIAVDIIAITHTCGGDIGDLGDCGGPTHQQCCEIQNKITPLFHNICLLLTDSFMLTFTAHETAMEYDARLVWKLVHEPDLRPSELRHKSDLPLAITYKQTYDEQVGITEADHTARHLT